MPTVDKQVRVFVSSTFRDMHAERDHLVTAVFPELRERIERLGLEFFDVDLRWGVPAKDANGETANSWEYCRQWIDRVEPFFVCILGQRYGWVPLARDFKSDEDEIRQESEPRSITDLEVRHAVLDDRKKRRSYFYLRKADAPPTATEYVDPLPLLRKLDQLKDEVRSCGRPVRDYPCEWTGSGFTGMEEFGRLVLEDLWSGVLRDERYVSKDVWCQVLGTEPDADPLYIDESRPVPRELWEKIVTLAKPEPKDPLDAEREQMDAFAASRLRWFQGRTAELRQLTDFLEATAAGAPRLAVVAAAPGQGKSALLATLHKQLQSSPHFVITHFVGATERSAMAYALVECLLGELDRSGITQTAEQQDEGQEPKRDFNSLCLRLAQRLGDYAGECRIVILLDALNQLSDGHDLRWLPARLGPSVRVVVSCVEDATGKADSPERRVLQALASRRPAPLPVPLGPLTEEDVRTIVVEYLKEYCHELDRQHLDTLCAISQARNPLYLLVMLNELRTLGGNDLNRVVPARIAAMPQDYPDSVSLFRWVLQRLEVFGPKLVRWWCLYLAHGRAGMASHELAELLECRLGAGAAASSLRIERGLRGYLLRRGSQLDFFHGQLRQAVMMQYASDHSTAITHSEIAEHFEQQPWFLGSADSPPIPNQRKCEEFLHQRLLAGAPQPVRDLLLSFELNEAKIAAGMIYDLIDEYSQACVAPAEPSDVALMTVLRQAIQLDSAFLQRHIRHYPQALLQCCYNSLGHLCSQGDSTFVDDANSSKLTVLLESWRATMNSRHPNSKWLRSRIPPLISPGTQLQTVCRQDPAKKARVRGPGLLLFPDNARLMSVSKTLEIRLFQADTGKRISYIPGDERLATDPMAISLDGKYIAGRCHETLRMWDADTASEVFCVRAPSSPVMHLAFSPDGSVIAGGALDGSIRFWGTRTGKELRCLRGNFRPIQCVAFSSSGSLLVTVSNDHTVRLWDATKKSRQLKRFRLPPVYRGGPYSACFAPWDTDLILVNTNRNVVLLDVKRGSFRLYRAEGAGVDLFPQSLSIDGMRQLYSMTDEFRVFDVRQEKTILEVRSRFLVGEAVAISPNGRLVATGIFDGIGVWDLDFDPPCKTVRNERYQQGVKDISTYGSSEDGDLKVVSGSADGSLCIWRYYAPFMKLVRRVVHKTDSEGNKFVTFSPNGALFGVINSGMRYTVNTVSLYDSLTNSLHAQITEHSDGIHSDVLSGTFFKRFPLVWSLPQGVHIEMEDLRRLHKDSEAQTTRELAVVNLRSAAGNELHLRRVEEPNQSVIAEDGELLIRDRISGAIIAYYAAGLSNIQYIPVPNSWAASSRAGLEILSLETSSTGLW